MNHHTVAAISIAGSCLDVLGSLYLAYDLLGGQHGPLRLLTRGVTYGIIYGVGYGLGLGPFFGLMSGIAFGLTAAIEVNRVARGEPPYTLPWQAFFSVLRGIAYGIGLRRQVGVTFAALFGSLIAAGQVVGYSRGISPTMDYVAARRPRLTRRQFWSTIVRTFGYCTAALICGALVHHVDWTLAIRIGLVTGLITGLIQTISPYIEYYADHMPARWLGVFGIGLILVGFALQSLQYWVALLDIHLS
jgi:hypothetical protein